MAARPLVSYDDITLPYQPTKVPFHQQHSRQHPLKKRRRKSKHCDDSSTHSNYYSNGVSNGNGSSGSVSTPFQEERKVSIEEAPAHDDYEEQEESRELTHEEIWDDSALVNAWEAATDEYEAYHGSDKAWKSEPVKKAPLWYNVPVESSLKSTSTKNMASAIPATTEGGEENDSQPINFDTFIPTHNPSLDQLSSLAPLMDYAQDIPGATMVSQDEAFSRALNAMYWGGYWTAMYHCQRNSSRTKIPSEDDPTDENDKDIEELDAEGVEEDEFISTQR